MINSLKKEKTKMVAFKISESDWKKVHKFSKKYTNSNTSAWIRSRIITSNSVDDEIQAEDKKAG